MQLASNFLVLANLLCAGILARERIRIGGNKYSILIYKIYSNFIQIYWIIMVVICLYMYTHFVSFYSL